MSIIKTIATFSRGPGGSPGKFLKIYQCSNFFDPPSLEFETFYPPLFCEFETFFDPTKFSSPHQGIYGRSLSFMILWYFLRNKQHWYHGMFYSRIHMAHNQLVITLFYYTEWKLKTINVVHNNTFLFVCLFVCFYNTMPEKSYAYMLALTW